MMNLIPIISFAPLVSILHFYMWYTVGKRSGSNNSAAIYVSVYLPILSAININNICESIVGLNVSSFLNNVFSYAMCNNTIDYSFQNFANPYFIQYLRCLIQRGFAAMLDGG